MTFPLYVYGVSLRGIPVQVNVLATMLFVVDSCVAIGLVTWPAAPGRTDGRGARPRARSVPRRAVGCRRARPRLVATRDASRVVAASRGSRAPPGPNKVECRPFASAPERTSATCGATIAADGRAVPPPGAPPQVREVIEAANRIAHRALRLGRRPPELGQPGLRLLRRGRLRAARRRDARPHDGLRPARALGRGRRRPLDHRLRQRQARLHGRRRPALRHPRRPHRPHRPALAHRHAARPDPPLHRRA